MLSAAESYPTFEVRGSGLECQAADGTGTAKRSYPASEARGSGQEKPLHV